MTKRGGGAPSHFEPSDAMRAQVMTLSSYGLTHKQIAAVVLNPNTGKGISTATLHKHFQDELDRGKPIADSQVIQSIFQRAVDLKHPQGATCAIWWTKVRCGWVATEKTVHEVQNNSGVLVAPANVTAEEWLGNRNGNGAKNGHGNGSDN